jgi:hypothetical protein
MKKEKRDLKSRKSAIKSLKSEMRKDGLGSLPEKMKGKMAVKVSADSPEELKKGLEMAEDTVETLEGSEGLGELLKDAFAKKGKKSKKEEE